MRFNPAEDDNFYKTSKFDVILISLILILSVASIVWVANNRIKQSSRAKIALIYQKDKLLERVALENDRTIRLLNGKMQIEVKGGKIRVAKADCPQHICVNTGWIQYSGQTIVCVPNKVLIEIKSTGTPLLDAVAK